MDLNFYSKATIRRCERYAINTLGLPEGQLMERAAEAALQVLQSVFPKAKRLAVFCGSGNNAGDAYLLAYKASQKGFEVAIFCVQSLSNLSEQAKQAADLVLAAKIPCQQLGLDKFPDLQGYDLLIDGLCGIGLSGALRPEVAAIVQGMNRSNCPIFALDLPSGLDADTGHVAGLAVRATVTLSFIGPKIGLYLAEGPDHAGKIWVNDLGLGDCLARFEAEVLRLDGNLPSLSPRALNSHKGNYGQLLIVGGGLGMPGAPMLAATAALRLGAGSLRIALAPQYATQAIPQLPEAMVSGLRKPADLVPLLDSATVCLLGPGLGTDAWARGLFSAVLESKVPLVLDASALQLLASKPVQRDNWVLSPHPGEAAALLQQTVAEVQRDRVQSARQIQARYAGTVVLKGLGSLVQSAAQRPFLCTAGNPGMASAGMGDVLAGMIAGLMTQGLDGNAASRLAVHIHATAGDEQARAKGQRGLLASDLIPSARTLLNTLNKS